MVLSLWRGFGPTRGTPVSTGIIITGTDPYLIDMACAKIAQFDYRKITTLRAAEDMGMITKDYHTFVANLDVSKFAKKFKEPKGNPLSLLFTVQSVRSIFLSMRNTAFLIICVQQGSLKICCSGLVFDKIII